MYIPLSAVFLLFIFLGKEIWKMYNKTLISCKLKHWILNYNLWSVPGIGDVVPKGGDDGGAGGSFGREIYILVIIKIIDILI